MKYSVNIAGKTYSVDIEDINARPVVAVVEGVRVEVTPENGNPPVVSRPASTPKDPPAASLPTTQAPAAGILSSKTMTAPLPGTVVEVFARHGDDIESGQVVLVIEAMKMKNSIRATHGGKVAQVLVNAGQTVAHKQALLVFE